MKISLHPLFIAVIILCGLFGGFDVAVIFALTATLHECGHVFCAAKFGYECSGVRLMPYGAAANIQIDGIRCREEVALALSGPLVNAIICVFVAGLWWFFPETYGWTDVIMTSNAAMLVVNLLPAYPLDGGRVFKCFVQYAFGKRVAAIILKVVAVAIIIALVACFFVFSYNITLITFAIFLTLSLFEKPIECTKIDYSAAARVSKGVDMRCVLVDKNFTYKQAIKLLDGKHYLVLRLYDKKILQQELSQDDLYNGFLNHTIYDKIFD
jgi:stage IV sporulation protein FB